jgi:hypothetical protein
MYEQRHLVNDTQYRTPLFSVAQSLIVMLSVVMLSVVAQCVYLRERERERKRKGKRVG